MKKRILCIVLLCLSCLSLIGCENVDAYKLKINQIGTKKEEIPEFLLGKEILLESLDGGKYGITFNKVKKTDKRNTFASNNIQDVIIIDYKFENYSVNNELLISEGIDFKVYDSNNNLLTAYPIIQSVEYPTPASQGVVSHGSVALGSELVLDTIKIEVNSQENSNDIIGYVYVDLTN